ncbi:hypothetical protein LQF76_11870 [Gloeomargaritales cyanobacterium VI4D9]|nr:hypothetical protein LQF76_11870 [Gloeomargaritales cyanobacterium VI4D9]
MFVNEGYRQQIARTCREVALQEYDLGQQARQQVKNPPVSQVR